jgi:acetone carboxylase beta subunit
MLNRVVQRKGLRCGLIVNRGMENFHRMGRAIQAYPGYAYEDRIHLNTHRYDPPLVPRQLTRGVIERIDMSGKVVIPLREDSVREAARDLIAADVEGIVISLLHSYKNLDHERRVRDIVANEVARSGKTIFASADYYPVRKETHRFTDLRVGDLSAGADVWLVLDGGHAGHRVAREKPGVAVTAFVQNSIGHLDQSSWRLFGS